MWLPASGHEGGAAARGPVGMRWLAPAMGALVAVLVSLAAVPPARADARAEGRKHVQRANRLAASGRCRQALVEYDKAIAALKDPALLFNRGECHRKLGEADQALEDYNQFLAELPNAPNRAVVESRIAGLAKVAPASAPAPTPEEAKPYASPAPAKVGALGGSAAGTSSSPSSPSSSSPSPGPGAPGDVIRPRPVGGAGDDVGAETAADSLTPSAAASTASAASPVEAPVPAAVEPDHGAPTLVDAPGDTGAAGGASQDGAMTHRPLFWGVVAAGVVAAGVASYFLFIRDPTNVPQSALGNYKF